MFAKNVVGRANSIAGGWENLGGGVTQLLVGSTLYPLFLNVFCIGNDDLAWRTVFVVPAALTASVGLILLSAADDCPYGNYSEGNDASPTDG